MTIQQPIPINNIPYNSLIPSPLEKPLLRLAVFSGHYADYRL
jgi:hypothetical protein